MRRVLVPTDFSPVSKNALLYGLELYKNSDTAFDIVHVYHPSFDPVQPEILDSSLGLENVKRESMKSLIKSIQEKANQNKVILNSKIEIGFTIEKIVELSQDYDLIIMGSTGSDSILNKIFGGISSDVAAKAECPVLLVPAKVKFTPLKKIIYSCDFDGVDERILHKVVAFAKRYDASIRFVHIQNKDKEFVFTLSDDLDVIYSVSIVEAESVREGISEYIKEENANLVIMATKHRSFWEKIIHKSHTKEFALTTDVPLLVYHEK
jgi:nucleotide-binding universal stress UspA family protein